MSHEVETMAYTNAVPWHGLGVKVEGKPTVKGMIKAAGLDWEVKRVSMTTLDGHEVPGYAALQRDKDGKIFGVVGPTWQPTQNAEGFEMFNEYVEAGDAHMETMGSLRDGKYVWGLANLDKSFKLKGKDEVKAYLLVMLRHQQGRTNLAGLTAVRVVCMNTLRLSLQTMSDEFRLSHRKVFDKNMQKVAKEHLGIARERFDEFADTAAKLQKMKMGDADAFKVFATVTGDKADTVDDAGRVTAKLMDVLHHAPGAEPGNAWGVLNAVTYYADHVASRSDDKRLTNAWVGKTNVMKQRALDLILA